MLAKELIDRCDGCHNVELWHGIRGETIRVISTGEQKSVQKKTAARLLTALAEQRKEDRRNGLSARFLAARKQQIQREARLERLAGY